jgi:hypothetical protein
MQVVPCYLNEAMTTPDLAPKNTGRLFANFPQRGWHLTNITSVPGKGGRRAGHAGNRWERISANSGKPTS